MPKDASLSRCSLRTGAHKSRKALDNKPTTEHMETLSEKEIHEQSQQIHEEWNAAAAEIKLLISEKSKREMAPRISIEPMEIKVGNVNNLFESNSAPSKQLVLKVLR